MHDPDTRRGFRHRLEDGMSRILFYVAPTTTVFIVVGDVVARLLFQRGKFSADDTQAVWYVVAAFSLGLPATTASRLLQNGLYALDDARTPARLAVIRVVVAVGSWACCIMFPLDRLTIVNGTVTGWDDMLALGGRCPRRSTPTRRASPTWAWWAWRWAPPCRRGWSTGCCPRPWPGASAARTWAAAGSTRSRPAASPWRSWPSSPTGHFGDRHAIVAAALVLGPAGVTYLGVTRWLGVPECLWR